MKFKLQSVLKLKENVEQVKKRELGLATIQRQGLETHREKLTEQKKSMLNETKNSQSELINIMDIKELRNYSAYIDSCIQKVSSDIVQAEHTIIEKKSELAEAMKQRQMMEKLKQIKAEQFEQEERQKENSLLDEMISYKYAVRIQ
ncbi:MAG: flagellar export protein FliJ [Cellulosilyticaceae bacterium]